MRTIFTLVLVAGATVALSADWPMWGGTPARNMVSSMTGAPTEWDVKTGKNVKWVAELGSQTYGNPTVGSGVVIVGTNNELPRDPKQGGDRGVLMAFRESTGEFLWQATFEKLSSGRANDWPFQGIASSPLIIDGIAYFVVEPRRGDRGRRRGLPRQRERRPYKDEKLTGKNDPDVVWVFDMMEEVGSFPHNLSNSSPVAYGNLLFVSTSNGQDESHVNIPSPKAPAIIAVDRATGKLVWEDNSVEDRILHGQWSTPSVGDVGGVTQVVHAQGDGWVRGYEALTGKKLWEFDTNPKDSVWPKTRNEVISTPVIYENVVYIANGQDPGARRGRRPRLRHRRHQARRHHRDGPALALRQDPPLDLDRRDQGRPHLPGGLQRLPALPRREDRPAVLDARHVRRDLGLADDHRRQGLPGRRGRRHGRCSSTARR